MLYILLNVLCFFFINAYTARSRARTNPQPQQQAQPRTKPGGNKPNPTTTTPVVPSNASSSGAPSQSNDFIKFLENNSADIANIGTTGATLAVILWWAKNRMGVDKKQLSEKEIKKVKEDMQENASEKEKNMLKRYFQKISSYLSWSHKEDKKVDKKQFGNKQNYEEQDDDEDSNDDDDSGDEDSNEKQIVAQQNKSNLSQGQQKENIIENKQQKDNKQEVNKNINNAELFKLLSINDIKERKQKIEALSQEQQKTLQDELNRREKLKNELNKKKDIIREALDKYAGKYNMKEYQPMYEELLKTMEVMRLDEANDYYNNQLFDENNNLKVNAQQIITQAENNVKKNNNEAYQKFMQHKKEIDTSQLNNKSDVSLKQQQQQSQVIQVNQINQQQQLHKPPEAGVSKKTTPGLGGQFEYPLRGLVNTPQLNVQEILKNQQIEEVQREISKGADAQNNIKKIVDNLLKNSF